MSWIISRELVQPMAFIYLIFEPNKCLIDVKLSNSKYLPEIEWCHSSNQIPVKKNK